MKMRYLAIAFLLIGSSPVMAQIAAYDSVAVLLLDRMSNLIGDLSSCSFSLATENDENTFEHGMVTQFGNHDVYMVGPDKMLVNSYTSEGHHEYWYDGIILAYYDHDENNYSMIPAPNNIISMIDSVHKLYDFQFPATDFFYPSFTDDLLTNFEEIRYGGRVQIGEIPTYLIIARSEAMDIQIYLADDAFNLPYKYIITDKTEISRPRYTATFSEWDINPDLPPAMFFFEPPPNAKQLRLISKNDLTTLEE